MGSNKSIKIFGILMILAMVSTSFASLISGLVSKSQTVSETPTPAPTVPAPPELSTIVFDHTYLHPSGLFTVGYPVEWVPGTPANNGVQATIDFSNSTISSIIQVYVEVLDPPLTTLDELSAYYTPALLKSTWSRYSSATETGRKQDGNKLIIDFDLTSGQLHLLARHVAWTDGQWDYAVRVVARENARDMLLDVLDKAIPTLTPLKQFAGTPVSWHVYFDNLDKHIIRFPSDWLVTDSAPGLPASISGNAGQVMMRVSAQDTLVADADAASAWVEAYQPDASILSVEPVEREGGSGFSVAYTFTNYDGDSFSGLAVILNGDDGKAHIANLRFVGDSIDLNHLDANAQADYTEMAEAMGTFMLMPNLNIDATN